MRVLVVAATPFFSDRGCHVRIYEELKHLARLGVQQVICTYHIGRDLPGLDIRRSLTVPWYKRIDAKPSIHKAYIDILVLLRAFGVCRRFRPEVIHAHTQEGAMLGILLGRLFRLPVVFDAQSESTATEITETYQYTKRRNLLHRTAAWIDRWVPHNSHAVIASSTRIARHYVEVQGLPADKVSVVLDGADTEMFHPRFFDARVKSELGLPEDSLLIAFVGLLEPHQGIDVLIEAMAHVAQATPTAHLLVMGFPRESEYRAKAEAMGLGHRVTFTGQMDYARLPRYLAGSDLAVAPKMSPNESNGKIYNYIASGLPVVAFDTEVNREVLGDLGVYAAYGNATELAAGMLALFHNRERRVELGRAVRRRAEEQFSWQQSAERIMQVYETLKRTRSAQRRGKDA